MDALRPLGYTSATRLGEGAYGQVYRCASALGEELAVKISTDIAARLATSQEAAVMALIPAHENLLPLHSFSSTAEAAVLAMPLAAGGDTLRYMQARQCKPLDAAELHSLFAQLLAAVEHMHRHGFVHRDIKCENILLSAPGRLLLADFGFATRYEAGAKSLTDPLGSLHYSSPEICAQVAYEGPEVDVWSMGVVLYAWATGRLPFGGANEVETGVRITTGAYNIPATVPADLASLLRGMLQVDPTCRLSLAAIRAHPWFAARASAASDSAATSGAIATSASKKRPASPERAGHGHHHSRIASALKRVFHLQK